MFRKPPLKEPSPSTKLVQQLYSFGVDPSEGEDQKQPSSLSTTLPSQPQASTSTLAPPITTALSNLSLAPPVPTSSNSNNKKSKKDPKLSSLRKLLKSTDHVIKLPSTIKENGEVEKIEERVLTSWKMADYAYKREPCPFPTRARGLFTEKSKLQQEEGGQEEEEEYRIVARGYDKFFNVGEVSWTQVILSNSRSLSLSPMFSHLCTELDSLCGKIVGKDFRIFYWTLRINFEIKRLYNLNRFINSHSFDSYFETFNRQELELVYRRFDQSFRERRVLVRQTFGKSWEN